MNLKQNLENYLKELYGEKVELISISELGELASEPDKGELKGFGYGKPYLINFSHGNKKKSVVLSSMRVQGGFGHDHFSDRAQILIWQHSTFNKLPKHVKSLDVGYFSKNGELHSAGNAEEYFILMEKVDGKEYFFDLERIMKNGITQLDLDKVKVLSSYLANIHKNKHDNPELYIRRIRDLVGHGECIMGLIDSYPDEPEFRRRLNEELEDIEKKCIKWRWKLKNQVHRLCMVHGDFHPWNVMFREGTDFTVLDRSRGEWGEAADDLSGMTINYIFYSLIEHGCLDKDFKKLYELFFENYLEKTQDYDILKVIPPFYVFRGLVVASPVWYPNIELEVRVKLFNFIKNILEVEEFDPKEVNSYLDIRY
ncbi:MAG TPA: aminoglycoside phosphotransferase family protein [Methanosarcinales archaeon]|nr:aminoglycoside phosphotransferase family protein [Methanosarcinales archaeon]